MLRDHASLILSWFGAGPHCAFQYEEPADTLGIGFHLKGGSHFVVDRSGFETRPLDIWAGSTPAGAVSTFTLPQHGFMTVSLRFSPDSVQDLLQSHGHETGLLADMARRANQEVVMSRLGSLDGRTARLVEIMLTPPYSGAARTLFLESCALGLLASQIDATTNTAKRLAGGLSHHVREKVFAAREHLDSNFTDPPTIAALARIVGTNEFTLKRGFKQAFGQTIFGYAQQRRMHLAATELKAGRSVQETAREAGYTCPRSFSDAFRRHFGTLPSSLLRRQQTQTPDHPT